MFFEFLLSRELWSGIYGLIVSPLPAAFVGLYGIKVFRGNKLWVYKVEQHRDLLIAFGTLLHECDRLIKRCDDLIADKYPNPVYEGASAAHDFKKALEELSGASALGQLVFSKQVIRDVEQVQMSVRDLMMQYGTYRIYPCDVEDWPLNPNEISEFYSDFTDHLNEIYQEIMEARFTVRLDINKEIRP